MPAWGEGSQKEKRERSEAGGLHRQNHPSRYTPVIPATPTQSARSQAPFFTKQRLAIYLSALVLFQIVTFNFCLPVVRGKFIDFRAFYAAGYMVRTGHAAELYDYDAERKFQSALVAPDVRALPMMALPYSALPFVPLSYLNFKHAYMAWFAVNILLLLLSAAALAPHLPNLVSIWKPAPYLLALSLFPVGIALMMGQISMLLLLIACVSFDLLQRGRPFAAGLIFALMLMKFQLALPVAALFLLWRQWRVVAGFVTGAGVVAALSAAILGARNMLPYLHSLLFMTRSISGGELIQFRYAIFPHQMPQLYGLIVSTFNWTPNWTHSAEMLTLAASAALFLWAAFQRPSFPFALLVGTLVSYHLFLYDTTILLLPLAVLLDRFVIQERETRAANTPPLYTPLAKFQKLAVELSAMLLLIAPLEFFVILFRVMYLLALPILAITLFARSLREPAAPITPAEPIPAAS